MTLPPKVSTMGLTIKECPYNNMPYIVSSTHKSKFQSMVPSNLCHNIWILAIGNNSPITVEQAKTGFAQYQLQDQPSPPIKIVIAKRDSRPTPTNIQNDWAVFDQFRVVPHHIVDSAAISVQTPGSTIKQAADNPTPLPPPSPILPETDDILQENTNLPSDTQCCNPVEYEDCNHTSTISPTDAPSNFPEPQHCPLIVDEVDEDSDYLP